MIPLESYAFEEKHGEDYEYGQCDYFLNHF